MKIRSLIVGSMLLLLCVGCGGNQAEPAAAGPESGGETQAASSDSTTVAPSDAQVSEPAEDGVVRLRIATGSKTGGYYRAATELRDLLAGSGYELEILESPGSYSNIEQVGTGAADLAFVQFDTVMVYMAMDRAHQEMANKALVIAPLNYEMVHILVRADSKLTAIDQLPGKKLGVGPQHSGSWICAFNLMFYLTKTNIDEVAGVEKLAYAEAISKVAAGELDATFVTSVAGGPLLSGIGAAEAEKLELLTLPADFELPRDLAWTYRVETIPANTYSFHPEEARVIATAAYLVASKDLDPEVVRAIAEKIYGQAEALRAKNDFWRFVSEERANQDIEADFPYHDGVLRLLGHGETP